MMLNWPFDNDMLLRKQKSLKRTLLAQTDKVWLEKKIAILGGSTTADIRNLLEIFLLDVGIKPTFYESEYNKYLEDSLFPNAELESFQPDIILLYTSTYNITHRPEITDPATAIQEKFVQESDKWQQIWQGLATKYKAIVVQNNFDFPATSPEGNLDASLSASLQQFVLRLNAYLADYANQHAGFYVNDMHSLSARIGLDKWHNASQYFAYKFATNYDVFPDIAWNIGKIIKAILGLTKKCLVLDLDNTLWGGVIGDDGLAGIKLGKETPLGEAYTDFQRYVKHLKDRGIILAVCSKNDADIAKSGFTHPDSVLSVDDFIAFHANWEPKNINIEQIAKELNIGLDSLVFIDDNPAERAIVRETLPMVAVPEVNPTDVFSFIRAIEGNGYFEAVSISETDLQRNQTYQENKQRADLQASSMNYDDFLRSLNMEAEIAPFAEVYFERIAQLTNKTNQFNLTTRRCTLGEIREMASSDEHVTLYCRLKDRFGDNGLISLVVAEKRGDALHIILWLMSCRVLKRGVEDAMMDTLVNKAKERHCNALVGYYYKTAKNGMVEEFFKDYGFELLTATDDNTTWKMDINEYGLYNKFISVNGQ